MDLINGNTVSAFVLLLLTLVMFLLLAILYNVRCSRLAKIHELQNKQHKEKKPEEHDERFATGRYFLVKVFIIVIMLVFMQKALIIGIYFYRVTTPLTKILIISFNKYTLIHKP